MGEVEAELVTAGRGLEACANEAVLAEGGV